jgi:RIO kinase 1
MKRNDHLNLTPEALGDDEHTLRIKNMPTVRRGKPATRRKPKSRAEAAPPSSVEQTDESFHFSYDASRHERGWIIDALSDFYDQQWFDDVLRVIKGGKEATVYQCLGNQTSGEPFIAAKVYRPRQFRNLRKDHIYREGRVYLDEHGREITNAGMLYAVRKRTTYGEELIHTSWIEHEVRALQVLHEAGADVPRPLASDNNAILMSYIGGEETPAPSLNGVRLERDEAHDLFQRVLHNIQIMLDHQVVHGDLSAYNILYWEGQITLIDFPQAIRPGQNPSDYRIFERDVVRVCEYFARMGVESQPRELAARMWMDHQYRLTPQMDPRLLADDIDADEPDWEDEQDED